MSDEQYNFRIEDVAFERDLDELMHDMNAFNHEESVVGKDPSFNLKDCERE